MNISIICKIHLQILSIFSILTDELPITIGLQITSTPRQFYE